MGTLQDELKKITSLDSLSFDDDPSQPAAAHVETSKPRLGVLSEVARGEQKSKTQLIWEWFKENPSSTTKEAATALAIGVNAISTTVFKLRERGLLARSSHGEINTYHVTVDEYPAFTLQDRLRNMATGRKNVPKRIPKVKQKSKPASKVALKDSPKRSEFLVETFINDLNIYQARAVYDALKKIFQG